MPQSVTLTASMRSNLASLKSIQSQMDTTQNRLSTGKKVNSAIDNASSYYQSRALTNRAADLDSLLDSMGQGIQTIQAANEGIEAVTSFIEQAKSVANSAYALDATATDYATQLASYQTQYNDILSEIYTLAKDSSYQGINLLKGSDLTVMFNETRTHSLTINGDDVTSELNSTGSAGFSWDTNNKGNISWTGATNTWTTATVAEGATHVDVSAGKLADNTDATGYASTATALSGDKYKWDTDHWVKDNAAGTHQIVSAQKIDAATGAMTTADVYVATGTTMTHNVKADTAAARVNDSLNAISKGIDYLRDYSSELGNNFSIIETRQNFTEALIDVLETGSDNLVLADMNEESANYLALQTRQQLAINSLSLASQSAQSVLKLF